MSGGGRMLFVVFKKYEEEVNVVRGFRNYEEEEVKYNMLLDLVSSVDENCSVDENSINHSTLAIVNVLLFI